MTKLKEKQNIPEEWHETTLSNISKVVAGFGFPIRFQGKKEGKYLFAKVSDMNRPGNEKYISYAENYLDEEDLKKIKVKTYPVGTIIFPKVGAALMTNKRRILKKEALIDNNIMGLIPNKIDSMYLYYWMLDFDVTQHVAQGALPSINQSYIEKLKLLLPESIKEQQKIAGILETMDADIKETKSVIKATEKLKKGLMQKLFTRGIGHTKFKQTELGEIPESWDVVSLEDVAKLSTGTTPSTNKLSYYQGDIPFIKTGQVVNNRINSTEVHVSEDAVSKYRLKKYQPGTVLMAMYGQGKTRGQVALLEIEACTTQNAAAIESGSKVDSEYLWFYLKSQYEKLRQSGVQGHISHLNLTILKKLRLALPPISEQKKTVIVLSVVDEKIAVNRKLLAKQTELKKGLMQDLLSGNKRVKV